MLFVLFIICVVAQSRIMSLDDSLYLVVGLTPGLSIVPESESLCASPISCSEYVLDALSEFYHAGIIPMHPIKPLNREHVYANLNVFGLNSNKMVIRGSNMTCRSFVDCVNYEIHFEDLMWIVFTGRSEYDTMIKKNSKTFSPV